MEIQEESCKLKEQVETCLLEKQIGRVVPHPSIIEPKEQQLSKRAVAKASPRAAALRSRRLGPALFFSPCEGSKTALSFLHILSAS